MDTVRLVLHLRNKPAETDRLREMFSQQNLPDEIIPISDISEFLDYFDRNKKILLIISYPKNRFRSKDFAYDYGKEKCLKIVFFAEKFNYSNLEELIRFYRLEPVEWSSGELMKAVYDDFFDVDKKKPRTREELVDELNDYKEKYEELKRLTEEYKKTNDELNEIQKKFFVFQEFSLYAFTILKAVRENGKIVDFEWTYVNETAAKVLKKSTTELIGSKLLEILPGNRENLYNLYVKVVETGEPHDLELYYENDGIAGWYRNMTIKMDDGVAITFSDITEKKQIEIQNEKLLHEERKTRKKLEETVTKLESLKEEYRMMGETVPFGAWKTDSKGEAIYISQSFLDLVGMTSEEAYKFGWTKNLLEEDKIPMLKKWNHCVKTGENWEYEHRILDKDGNLNYILAKGLPIKNSKNEIEAWIGVNIDVTERRKLDEELKNTNNEIKEILERVSDSFLAVDKQWKIKYINENARVPLIKNDTVIGKNLWEVFPILVNTEVEKHYKRAMDEQVPVCFESKGIANSRWFNISLYPSENGLTIYSQDITERKKAQDGLKAALKEKEILIKEVHHRVKNNLQIISSLLNLQANYIEDEKAIEYFKDSQTRIRSMAIVHEQLYHSSHLSSLNFKDYINDLIHKLLTTYRFSNYVQMNMNVKDVYVNLEIGINLGLIINELVLNSLKHAFVIKNEGEIEITLIEEGNDIKITIKDNGDGLPEGFDINNTESFGMQLVCALIEQMHGTISVINDNGTTFMFSIPVGEK